MRVNINHAAHYSTKNASGRKADAKYNPGPDVGNVATVVVSSTRCPHMLQDTGKRESVKVF